MPAPADEFFMLSEYVWALLDLPPRAVRDTVERRWVSINRFRALSLSVLKDTTADAE
jgi:hypothetical protein